MTELSNKSVLGKALPELVTDLYAIRKQKAELEKTEKLLLGQIKPLVDPLFDQIDTGLRAGNLMLSRISGTSRTISADKLLERGVAPDIIAFATNTVPYFQYRIKEA